MEENKFTGFLIIFFQTLLQGSKGDFFTFRCVNSLLLSSTLNFPFEISGMRRFKKSSYQKKTKTDNFYF